MPTRNFASACVALLLAAAGCSAPKIQTDFSVKHGENTVRLVDSRSQAPLIAAKTASLWKIGDTRISMAIENRTDTPLKIVWDQCSFTDTEGKTHAVLHGGMQFLTFTDARGKTLPVGIQFLENDRRQWPTVVAAHASLTDVLMPKDGIVWAYNRWAFAPLFPDGLKEQMRFSVRLAFEASGMLSYDDFEFTVLSTRTIPPGGK